MDTVYAKITAAAAGSAATLGDEALITEVKRLHQLMLTCDNGFSIIQDLGGDEVTAATCGWEAMVAWRTLRTEVIRRGLDLDDRSVLIEPEIAY